MSRFENETEETEKLLNEKLVKVEQESREAIRELKELQSEKEKLVKELNERDEKMKLYEKESLVKISNLKRDCEEKIQTYVMETEKNKEVEMEILKADLEAQYITQLSDQETELNEVMIKSKELNEKLNQEISFLRNEKKHLEELYEEEKTESGALRLRIQLLSNGQQNQQMNLPVPGPLSSLGDQQKSKRPPQAVDFP